MFTDEFVRSDQQLNTYDDYWGAVFEWARRNDGKEISKDCNKFETNTRNCGNGGRLKIWDKRHRNLGGIF